MILEKYKFENPGHSEFRSQKALAKMEKNADSLRQG
jgi:hypothetical protein